VTAAEALARLRRLGIPVVETADAAAALSQKSAAASRTLSRLANAGLIVRVRHGVWWIDSDVDPHRLVEYLSAPYPSYLSLQSALYLHGMIEQIPETYYAVSLARTQSIRSRVGTFSFHHITPELFGGFEKTSSGVALATPEKALFDVAYLSGVRSRLFASLPELELPRGFNRKELARWIERVRAPRRRAMVRQRLATWTGVVRKTAR
jgi:predicted transcriptional regulator of viral defense system